MNEEPLLEISLPLWVKAKANGRFAILALLSIFFAGGGRAVLRWAARTLTLKSAVADDQSLSHKTSIRGRHTMASRFLLLIAAFSWSGVAAAQADFSTGRWRFGESTNGELAAEIWTEVGHGVRVHVAFQCNEGGRYSYIASSGVTYPIADPLHAFIGSYMDGDLRIETYRLGTRTNSFRPTGFHEGEGDEVTDQRLRSLQEADFILITGGKRPIALPATNSKIAIAQYMAACGVYGTN